MDSLVKGESRSASFCAKVAPCLWRADPSFMNSVARYSYVVKSSNFLQDKVIVWTPLNEEPCSVRSIYSMILIVKIIYFFNGVRNKLERGREGEREAD